MNKYHQEILKKLEGYKMDEPYPNFYVRYCGTHSPCLGTSSPEKQLIAKTFIREHPDFSLDDYVELLSSFARGKYHDEKCMVGTLLVANPKLARQISPELLDVWLNNFEGWLEVDSLCQSSFDDKALLGNWKGWERVLRKFNKDKLISKRRASLVLLNKTVAKSDDSRASNLALENIERLKSEKDILITKAISWLMREMIKYHRARVEEYLSKNAESLPKIAVRETRNKLVNSRK